jgi:crotonobetainyl-CoA:carnitine CoA-transferase CaiB-like acyl-CoA transferase
MSILSGYRVLDLSRVRSGPSCVRMLSDWGADVVAVERHSADGEDDAFGSRHSSDFQNLHRNKRSIAIDLKSEAGLEIFMRLVDHADVVVENFRPDVKARLGIDYESLRTRNPRIVLASISGFGEDGPYADRPGVDQIAQGMGGLMSITGEPGQGPMRVGIAISDMASGLYMAFGIVLALLGREKTGEGQWVRTSLLASQISMLDFQAARWLVDGVVPKQAGNSHPTTVPTAMFKTQDGHINLAATSDSIFRRLCKGLGVPEWADDPDVATAQARSRNREEVRARISEIVLQKTSAVWVAELNALGVPCGEINSIDQVYADPQVRHLGLTGAVEHEILGKLTLQKSPLQMSGATPDLVAPAPECGEHTLRILRELGYSETEVEALVYAGIVGQSAQRAQKPGALG